MIHVISPMSPRLFVGETPNVPLFIDYSPVIHGKLPEMSPFLAGEKSIQIFSISVSYPLLSNIYTYIYIVIVICMLYHIPNVP
jgi:hypothetical protein